MKTRPIISLCIPTNGISEWVFPVLESIYTQNVDTILYEVIVTNNGDNTDFHEQMILFSQKHENLVYKKTNAYMFENQLEALKIAKGEFLKFINHRSLLVENALSKLIETVKDNIENKPTIFFSNGVLEKERYVLDSFDNFVCTLRRFASWTTGVGIWKEDYEKLPKDFQYDKISPHSALLFAERNKNSYLVENYIFSDEITTDHSKKGKYDLFKAFAVEEFTITLKLYIDGDISAKTLKYVKKDYRKMVSELYLNYMIRKKPCSYDLTGFNDSMGIFYNKTSIILGVFLFAISALFNKIKKIMKRK